MESQEPGLKKQWEDMLGFVGSLEENGLVRLDEKP